MARGDDRTPIPIRQNRWIALLAVFVLLALATWLLMRPSGPAPPTDVDLDPRATYLRTSAVGVEPARALSLEELGVEPGDSVRLVRRGTWAQGTGTAFGHLIAVFSATDSLAPPEQAHRVPGALPAGGRMFTGRNPVRGFTTDIPEDFGFGGPQTDSITVRVPEGARYLFVAPADERVGDNQVAEAPFGVRIVPLTPRSLLPWE